MHCCTGICTYPNSSYPVSQVYFATVPTVRDSSDNDTLAFIGTAGWPHFSPVISKITTFSYLKVTRASKRWHLADKNIEL